MNGNNAVGAVLYEVSRLWLEEFFPRPSQRVHSQASDLALDWARIYPQARPANCRAAALGAYLLLALRELRPDTEAAEGEWAWRLLEYLATTAMAKVARRWPSVDAGDLQGQLQKSWLRALTQPSPSGTVGSWLATPASDLHQLRRRLYGFVWRAAWRLAARAAGAAAKKPPAPDTFSGAFAGESESEVSVWDLLDTPDPGPESLAAMHHEEAYRIATLLRITGGSRARPRRGRLIRDWYKDDRSFDGAKCGAEQKVAAVFLLRSPQAALPRGGGKDTVQARLDEQVRAAYRKLADPDCGVQALEEARKDLEDNMPDLIDAVVVELRDRRGQPREESRHA